MSTHHLQLRYDGLSAAKGTMDAGDAHEVIEGGKRLLAAHAYYYLLGDVPDRLFSQADGFRVDFAGTRKGSLFYDLTVSILGAAIYDLAVLPFGAFLWHAFASWREGRLFEEPEFIRRDPVLDVPWSASNHPIFDFGAHSRLHRQRLAERTSVTMDQITRPVGRSALTVGLMFDGRSLGTWDRRVGRLWTNQDLEEAIRLLPRHGRGPHAARLSLGRCERGSRTLQKLTDCAL